LCIQKLQTHLIIKIRLLFFMKKIECAYCEELLEMNQITRDHVFPRSKGGKCGKGKRNIIYCCYSCNSLKKDMHIGQFFKFLDKKLDQNLDPKFMIRLSKVKNIINSGTKEIREKQQNIIKYNHKIKNQKKQAYLKQVRKEYF
jgi:hypothetical protein